MTTATIDQYERDAPSTDAVTLHKPTVLRREVRRKAAGVYELYDRLYVSPLYAAYKAMGFHQACRAMRKAVMAAWSMR